ncbi:MAG: HEAT repeat domain-containing protein [Pseudomonadota bacterium]
MTGLERQAIDVADPAAVIVRYLREDDAVIRCAGAKALGALADRGAASALVDALLDEDPDVRTDAMEALITCAGPCDAAAILRSLEGDPVKEVKVLAIRAIARLEDRAAIPLIRRLAKDRAEDMVAWEDDAGMWDDWLDVQIVAIEALGHLQASEAIDDLLEARTDEMGQELDEVIFPTLARIEEGGMTALLGFLRDRDARVRERAVKAMAKARPETLRPMRDLLLQDKSPAVRRLAVSVVDPENSKATELALHDPDSGVRKSALEAFGEHRPALLEAALGDPDEEMRATALKALVDGDHTPLPADLADNAQAWMTIADAPLATVAIAALPRLLGQRSMEPLRRLAEENERPIEVRIAAISALGETSGDGLINALRRCVVDPTSQIRAAALAALANLAEQTKHEHQQDAAELLASAIGGGFGTEAKAHPPLAERQGDLAASKVEGGPGHVTITPEGDIVTADVEDDTVIEGHFPKSTLDAIQTIDRPAEEKLADGPKPMKRRVPVDGPADVATDIRKVALTMAAKCQSALVTEALIDALSDKEPTIRAAAFRSLTRRSLTSERSALEKIDDALEDPDPAIRHDAARILVNLSPEDVDARLSILLGDDDAMVRGFAIGQVGRREPTIAIKALEDRSDLVRRHALDSLVDDGNALALEGGVQVCLAKGHADTLADCLKRCPNLREPLLLHLGDEQLGRLEILTALEALASA